MRKKTTGTGKGRTKLGKGNYARRKFASVATAVIIATGAGGALAACGSSGDDNSSQTTSELAQLNQDSSLVQGRDGCIKGLIAQDTSTDTADVKAANAAKTCDDMIAKAQQQGMAQGQAQQYNDDTLMWFMFGGPPMMYYGNPAMGLNLWYANYALNSGMYGSRYGYDKITQITINNYTSGSSAQAPKTLSPTQTSYLKASPTERPGISQKAVSQPGAKVVRDTTGKTGSTNRGGLTGGSSGIGNGG